MASKLGGWAFGGQPGLPTQPESWETRVTLRGILREANKRNRIIADFHGAVS